MPSRRLPNSISSRLGVLLKVEERLLNTPADEIPFSTETKTLFERLFPLFKTELNEKEILSAERTASTSVEQGLLNDLNILNSHFIQVFNFGVVRGLYLSSDRKYYGLEENKAEVPYMGTEQLVKEWALSLIDGEKNRLGINKSSNDKITMCQPSAKDIQRTYDRLITESAKQSDLKQKFSKETQDVVKILPEMDGLIKDIYDEVEFHYRRLERPAMRYNAKEWGVIYVADKGETPEEGVLTEDEFNNINNI